MIACTICQKKDAIYELALRNYQTDTQWEASYCLTCFSEKIHELEWATKKKINEKLKNDISARDTV